MEKFVFEVELNVVIVEGDFMGVFDVVKMVSVYFYGEVVLKDFDL